jgi:hypothetical protein
LPGILVTKDFSVGRSLEVVSTQFPGSEQWSIAG